MVSNNYLLPRDAGERSRNIVKNRWTRLHFGTTAETTEFITSGINAKHGIRDGSAVRAIRLATVAISLAACFWFLLGARQAIDTNRAKNIIESQQHLDETAAAHAASLLSAARTLNPDRTIDILRARLDAGSGKRVAGEGILLSVVRSEPLNAAAWYTLGSVAPDRPTAVLALGRVAGLVTTPP